MKKKIKLVKWIIGFIALTLILIHFIEKIIQLMYLNSIDWNVASFSPIYLFLGLIASLLFVSLAFLERVVHKTRMLSAEQLIVLVLGISGIAYSSLMLFLRLKTMVVV